MKMRHLAGAWAAAIWLAIIALSAPAQAEDVAQAAAAAKASAQALADYVRGVGQDGRRPDYAKPEMVEHLHRVFNAEALATLPPPQAGDMQWLVEWTGTANQIYKMLLLFGVSGAPDQNAAMARNLAENRDNIDAAMAFLLRLSARTMTTGPLFLKSLPPEPEQKTKIRIAGIDRIGRGMFQMAFGSLTMLSAPTQHHNAKLLASALQDTVAFWARYGNAGERAVLLKTIEQVRAASKDSGVDAPLAAGAAAVSALKS